MAEYTATTNASGIADFGYVPLGTYTLEQTVAVDGYNIITSEQVVIDSISETISRTNSPTNPKTLTITKFDQDGQPLAGATFVLYDSTGTIALDSKTTTSDPGGNVLTFPNLASTTTGKQYQYRESVVPEHYTANTDLVVISVTDDIAAQITNTLAEGQFTLELSDAAYNALKLAAAQFRIYN